MASIISPVSQRRKWKHTALTQLAPSYTSFKWQAWIWHQALRCRTTWGLSHVSFIHEVFQATKLKVILLSAAFDLSSSPCDPILDTLFKSGPFFPVCSESHSLLPIQLQIVSSFSAQHPTHRQCGPLHPPWSWLPTSVCALPSLLQLQKEIDTQKCKQPNKY